MVAERQIDSDILIIGGGSAGSMAAITAKEINPSIKVTIFEKGDIKYSGCISRGMDALNIVIVPGISTPEQYLQSNRKNLAGVLDSKPSLVLAERSYGLLKKLESWGVHFPKGNDGKYQMPGIGTAIGPFLLVMEEPNLKAILAEKISNLGCIVLNRTAGVRLLTEGERVVGAVGINTRTGEMVVCRAKAVIISAGGTARFGLPNTGALYSTFDFSGNTGDGYCIGFEAGAGLTGFECIHSLPIVRDLCTPLLSVVMPRGAYLVDAFGERLPDSTTIEDMFEVIAEGRGPLSMRMSHLSEQKIREIENIMFGTERPVQQRFFQKRGIDFRKQDVELNPTEFFLCGGHGAAGMVVNEKAETAVPGLFAAGDSASVPRQFLTGAFVFGGVAAESAIVYSERQKIGEINRDQVSQIRQKGYEILNGNKGTIGPDEFEYKVRRIINEFVVPPKNEYKLKQAQSWMGIFRQELKTQLRVDNYHGLIRTFEIEHIIQSAALSASASMERKESRWGIFHKRTDYPKTDNEHWLKHIILSRGERPEDIKVSYKQVE